ncbi:unnamed protein product [Rangifer tarandus platyrhynchus]|uniref:Uncharacterized protein n=1 Tax=Rangifer tarandus platyrhynchus TaxID=3082113 RepID=A0AC59YAS5_RANTA
MQVSEGSGDDGGVEDEDPAVLTIVLFHRDPPIPTALQPDICLEPPYMDPCKAKIIRHFYNAKSSWGVRSSVTPSFPQKPSCKALCLSAALLVLLGTVMVGILVGEISNQAQGVSAHLSSTG